MPTSAMSPPSEPRSSRSPRAPPSPLESRAVADTTDLSPDGRSAAVARPVTGRLRRMVLVRGSTCGAARRAHLRRDGSTPRQRPRRGLRRRRPAPRDTSRSGAASAVDDHNNPVLLIEPDQRLTVFYSRHDGRGGLMYRRTERPARHPCLGPAAAAPRCGPAPRLGLPQPAAALRRAPDVPVLARAELGPDVRHPPRRRPLVAAADAPAGARPELGRASLHQVRRGRA